MNVNAFGRKIISQVIGATSVETCWRNRLRNTIEELNRTILKLDFELLPSDDFTVAPEY